MTPARLFSALCANVRLCLASYLHSRLIKVLHSQPDLCHTVHMSSDDMSVRALKLIDEAVNGKMSAARASWLFRQEYRDRNDLELDECWHKALKQRRDIARILSAHLLKEAELELTSVGPRQRN